MSGEIGVEITRGRVDGREEIGEMMAVEEENKLKFNDKEAMAWHVRVLSLVLLRGGWNREDVVYSLGVVAHQDQLNAF